MHLHAQDSPGRHATSLIEFYVVPCDLVLATLFQVALFFHSDNLSPPEGHMKSLPLHVYFLQSFLFELAAYSPWEISGMLIFTGTCNHVVPTDGANC